MGISAHPSRRNQLARRRVASTRPMPALSMMTAMAVIQPLSLPVSGNATVGGIVTGGETVVTGGATVVTGGETVVTGGATVVTGGETVVTGGGSQSELSNWKVPSIGYVPVGHEKL